MAREDAAVSAALDLADEVRAFYESHSYPAPFKSLDEQCVRFGGELPSNASNWAPQLQGSESQ